MTLSEQVDRFINDTNIAHMIIHGDSNTVVQTEGGPVRSFAKVIADADLYLISGVDSLMNIIISMIPTAQELEDALERVEAIVPETSENPPVDPIPGKTWIDSTNGRKYIWVVDADGGQWVEAEAALLVDNNTAIEVLRDDLLSDNGSTLVGYSDPSNGVLKTLNDAVRQLYGMGVTPKALGQIDPTSIGSNSNVFIGGWGTWDSQAQVKTRPVWDALSNPPTSVEDFDLGLTGHTLHTDPNSSVIIGGRPAYYNYIGPKGSLTCVYGGDNYVNHLAGMVFGFHCDLLSDNSEAQRGDHGGILGGSFKQISGSYSGSIMGTIHQVNGISSVSVGGSNIKIGDISDSALVRRCVTLGGYLLNFISGFESAMIGGNTNTFTSGKRSVMLGGEFNEMAADCSVTMGRYNKATALSSVAMGTYTIADLPNALTISNGRFSTAGDNQTYILTARREFVGVSAGLSITGASGIDILTVPPNCVGTLELNVNMIRVDTVGETASFHLRCSFTNIGGTLVIKGQTLTVDHEDDPGYNLVAVVAGTGTRLGVVAYTPSATHQTRWTGGGMLVLQSLK